MANDKKSGFFGEFKKFISRGNVMDLAVGVIIGGAFTAIVNSLVNDILMPLIGLIMAGINVKGWVVTLPWKVGEDAAPVQIMFGSFIQAIITFFLTALCVFIIVKLINKLHDLGKKKEEEKPAAPPAPSKEEVLLTEIRDLLKAQAENSNTDNE